MTIYYLIGSTGDYGDQICYLPDQREKPIFMECSIPHMAASAFLTPEEALESKWDETFRDAHAEWFRPFLHRMAAGERVNLDELQNAHKSARGNPLLRVEDPRDLDCK
jgi:hypothetical protein